MSEQPLAIGDAAPPFSLSAVGGAPVTLSELRGKTVVLYFYPKDDTPGCTREACGFQGALARFAKADAVVLGVSRDPLGSHQRFAKKYGLIFPLLSDPEGAVCRAYGVFKQKSMYGRTYWGIERTTFIIDAQGRIANIFPKVSVDGHTEAVLKAVRSRARPDSPRASAAPPTGTSPRQAKRAAPISR